MSIFPDYLKIKKLFFNFTDKIVENKIPRYADYALISTCGNIKQYLLTNSYYTCYLYHPLIWPFENIKHKKTKKGDYILRN